MPKRDPGSTKVAVLMGGWSVEREVSLSSGKACAEALRNAGFKVETIDARRDSVHDVLRAMRPDVAFNALHGKWGEDGQASALLETLQIPYTHSGVLASSMAMNKAISKTIFQAANLPVAESIVAAIEEVARDHPMAVPYVVKPICEGSSLGVHIVTDKSNGPAAIILMQRDMFGSHAMVERFIPGRELTCAVMGDKALGVIDIVSTSNFYDYHSKYAKGGSRHILPAVIPPEIYEKCQAYSLMAHQALGCRGVSRCDFRYDEKAKVGQQLYLLEINTQPGMTGTSLVPEMAAHAGYSFEELVTWMVADASLDR